MKSSHTRMRNFRATQNIKHICPGWRGSSIQHLIEIGCVAPELALLGNLTITTAAVSTTSKTNAHLLSVVTAEAGAMRVEVGVVAAKTKMYCCSSNVGAPARARNRPAAGRTSSHSTNIFLLYFASELLWLPVNYAESLIRSSNMWRFYIAINHLYSCRSYIAMNFMMFDKLVLVNVSVQLLSERCGGPGVYAINASNKYYHPIFIIVNNI